MGTAKPKQCVGPSGVSRPRLVYKFLAVLGLVAFPLIALESGLALPGMRPASHRGMELTDPERLKEARDPAHHIIAGYLARRYRIAIDAIEQVVGAAHRTGQQLGLDPLLILSVIAIESRFNPIAESEMGAKGLMQVMPQHHQDKLAEHGGNLAVLDPMTNILVGAQILKDCIRRGGGVEAGLQLYAGAFGDPESLYAQKVIAERARMDQVLRRAMPTNAASFSMPGPMS